MGKYTAIDDPSKYCQSLRYTGNGASGGGTGGTRDLTFTGNSDMKPDMAIHIAEDHNQSHMITDSSRNWDVGNNELLWNGTNIEGDTNATNTGGYGWIGDGLTDGIQANAGSGGDGYANRNNEPFYLAAFKCNGGTTSNLSGNLDSVVQVNQDAGFSIVKYTGSGGNGQSVLHGLGSTPEVIMTKARNGVDDWYVYHKSLGNTQVLKLNVYAGKVSSSVYSAAAVSSSAFFVSTSLIYVGELGADFVSYCFAPIQGYSKFGSYVGNGHSEGDGPFVYTGFKPSFVITKRTDTNGSWLWHDAKWGKLTSSGNASGNNSNPLTTSMVMESGTNVVDDYGSMDILSNGFKLRSDAAATNASTAPYVYMAWAENPFVTSTGIMGTAR